MQQLPRMLHSIIYIWGQVGFKGKQKQFTWRISGIFGVQVTSLIPSHHIIDHDMVSHTNKMLG